MSTITAHEVPTGRLNSGLFGGEQGDIYASYSADTIAFEGKIRKLFPWQGRMMIVVSFHGDEATAYGIVPLSHFTSEPVTDNQKANGPDHGEAATNDPNGFYHGMTVQSGKQTLVLSGPPMRFIPGTDQASGHHPPEGACSGPPSRRARTRSASRLLSQNSAPRPSSDTLISRRLLQQVSRHYAKSPRAGVR